MTLEKLDAQKIIDDTSVDKMQLDTEHVNQPRLMSEYSELQAQADLSVAQLKDLISFKSSQLANGYRTGALDSGGLGKLTNDMVKELVEINIDVQNLKKEYNDMIYKSNILKGAVESLRMKRKSIDGLQYLWGNDYYSGTLNTIDFRQERANKLKEKK